MQVAIWEGSSTRDFSNFIDELRLRSLKMTGRKFSTQGIHGAGLPQKRTTDRIEAV